MKSFILVRDVLEARDLEGSDPFVVHKDNFESVYGENTGGDLDLVLFLHADLTHPLLYKFIEDYRGSVRVYSTKADDRVFLSRFSDIRAHISFVTEEIKPGTPWTSTFNSIKKILRART